MPIFRAEPKFELDPVILDNSTRRLSKGETGTATESKLKYYRSNSVAGRVQVVSDEIGHFSNPRRRVTVTYCDEPGARTAEIPRGAIEQDNQERPSTIYCQVHYKDMMQRFKDSELFGTLFTRDQQRICPVKLAYAYSRSKLALTGRVFWVYSDTVYSTTLDMTPEELHALIKESDRKKAAQIAKALKNAAKPDTEAIDRRAPIPDDVKIFVWQRDQGRCVKCGSNEKLEFDHIIPWSIGGSDSARNIQLLCEECNRLKGASLT